MLYPVWVITSQHIGHTYSNALQIWMSHSQCDDSSSACADYTVSYKHHRVIFFIEDIPLCLLNSIKCLNRPTQLTIYYISLRNYRATSFSLTTIIRPVRNTY